MSDRREYEMTEADYDLIIAASRPVPYLIIGGIAPMSQQERANIAWASLGQKMGFKYMTVRPGSNGKHSFTAEPLELVAPR